MCVSLSLIPCSVVCSKGNFGKTGQSSKTLIELHFTENQDLRQLYLKQTEHLKVKPNWGQWVLLGFEKKKGGNYWKRN